MARTGYSSSNLLRLGSVPLSGAPLTIAAWIKPAAFGANEYIAGLFNSGVTTHRIALLLDTSGVPNALATDAGGTSAAVATAAASAGAWSHICGVFALATDRRVFLNGANKGTSVTSRTPTGLDRVSIGLNDGSGASSPANGPIAHVSIWNIALSDTDVASLATGMSPLLMHPEALVPGAYWPLIGLNSPEPNPLSNANVMSIVGSLSAAADPAIFMPS